MGVGGTEKKIKLGLGLKADVKKKPPRNMTGRLWSFLAAGSASAA